jgi:hypothetical protein
LRPILANGKEPNRVGGEGKRPLGDAQLEPLQTRQSSRDCFVNLGMPAAETRTDIEKNRSQLALEGVGRLPSAVG